MSGLVERGTLVALVDDDVHSTRLLTRLLAEHGVTATRWLGNAARSQRVLTRQFESSRFDWPSLVIVGLHASSAASADFISAIRIMAEQRSALVVALTGSDEAKLRQHLITSGAAAVFKRHPVLVDYRREVGDLVEFWGLNQGLRRVGT